MLKSLRTLHKEGALEELIAAYRSRVAVGQIVDPSPDHAKLDFLVAL